MPTGPSNKPLHLEAGRAARANAADLELTEAVDATRAPGLMAAVR